MSSKPHDAPNGETRRDFIRTAAAGVALASDLVAAPATAQSRSRIIGANDRIAVAYVGTGSQGTEHVKSKKPHAAETNMGRAAVCAVYQRRLDRARTITGVPEPSAVRDHRHIMDRKDIDAVIVSTVDNWHADVAIDALESGKHV